MVVWNAVKQIGSSRGRIANYASWHSCFWLGERSRKERKRGPGQGPARESEARRASPREELQANP